MKLLDKFPKWLPALVMMTVIFIFSSIPSTSSGGLPDFHEADFLVKKSAHMLGYALLALAYLHAFGGKLNKWKLIWLLTILFAASDEFHQLFTVGREGTLLDVGIDALGAGLGLLLAKKTSAFRHQIAED